MLDDGIYQLWESQVLEDPSKNIVIITGKAAPRCGGCGKERKEFAVRFRMGTLPGGPQACKEKVLATITDQLNE